MTLVLQILILLCISSQIPSSSEFVKNLKKVAIPGILDHRSVQNYGLRCVDSIGDGRRGKGLLAVREFRAGDLMLKVCVWCTWCEFIRTFV